MLIIILSIVAVGLILAIILLRRRKVIPSDIDLMEGHDFEYYCAELLKKRGFQEVEVTKESGASISLRKRKELPTLSSANVIPHRWESRQYRKPTPDGIIMTGWWGRC